MALKAGYKGIKDVGDGLQITTDGVLEITGESVVIPNPEGEATESLTKLEVGSTIYGIEADTSDCYKTSDGTESNIVDADYIPFLDSSAGSGSGAAKKSTWSNFVSKVAAKLPAADPSTKGVVKVGAGLNINNSDELFIQGGNGITVTTENDEEWVNATSDAKISEAITGLVTTADTVQDALEGLAEWVSANPSNPNGADLVALQIGSTKYPLPFDKYFPRSEQAVLGAKNVLPFLYEDEMSKTVGNTTFTVNSNGSVTVDTGGEAASSDANFQLLNKASSVDSVKKLLGKTWILNGMTGGDNSFYLAGNAWGGSTAIDTGDGATLALPSNATGVNVYIKVVAGKTVDNVTVSPMLSFDGGEFVPPAMTNKELTESLAVKTLTLTKGTNINTVDNIYAYQIGKVVYVSGFYQTSAAMASKEAAFSGLPTPKAYGDLTRPIVYDQGSYKLGSVEGSNFYVRDTVASGDTVVFTFSYVAS